MTLCYLHGLPYNSFSALSHTAFNNHHGLLLTTPKTRAVKILRRREKRERDCSQRGLQDPLSNKPALATISICIQSYPLIFGG